MNRIYLAAMVLAAGLSAAHAQRPNTNTQPGQNAQTATGISQATRKFVENATIGGMYEIQSSKIALDKVQGGKIQSFAQKIIDDHTKSSNELKSLLQNMQARTPSELDAKHKQMVDRLQSASGPQFNRLYKRQQIEAHQQAIRLFETYARQGDNAQLQRFADKTVPSLRQHLEMAQNLPEQSQGVAQRSGGYGVNERPQRQTPERQSDAQLSGDRRETARQRLRVIAAPGPDHIIASDLTGTTVYGANDEEIGEINEIILSRRGELIAIVVGVGGFLGIGEKDVAVPFQAIEIATEAETTGTARRTNGGQADRKRQSRDKGTATPQRIILRGMTKQDLEDAPKFENEQN